MEREIPVYIFTGFLGSGKTRYIRNALADPGFAGRENVLIIRCEDGELEYGSENGPCSKITIASADDRSTLSARWLASLFAGAVPDKIIVEYNGMWTLDAFKSAMPANWRIYQEFFLADSRDILIMNANMRALVYDKLKDCSCVIFNRSDDENRRHEFHRLVRAANVRCYIFYEASDGTTVADTVQDPLPFDKDSGELSIEDRYFALWYRDISADPASYIGKTVTVRGCFAQAESEDGPMFGRDMMICCEADIQFSALHCRLRPEMHPAEGWYKIKACIKEHPDPRLPVMLDIIELSESSAPENPVATFY